MDRNAPSGVPRVRASTRAMNPVRMVDVKRGMMSRSRREPCHDGYCVSAVMKGKTKMSGKLNGIRGGLTLGMIPRIHGRKTMR